MSVDAPPRPQVTDEPPRRSSPHRAPIGTVTLGLALVTVGVLWLVSTLGVDIPLRIIGPVLLIVIGLGVAAAVDARVAGGSADVLGEVEEGLGVSNERRTDGYEDASRRVLLTVRVGLGEVHVREVPGHLTSTG